MTPYILKRLQKAWQGPPITFVIGASTYQLGEGAPRTTVVIKNAALLPRLLRSVSLGFGEAYMNKEIEVEGDIMDVLRGFHTGTLIPPWIRLVKRLKQNPAVPTSQAVKNAQRHYDIGNDFYALWLDEERTYSCAYFENGNETLDEAQFKKRDLICRKLRLDGSSQLLDIGCGWGSLLFHAAEHWGATVVGLTPAKEQAAHIEQEARQRGLAGRVRVIQNDWRVLPKLFQGGSLNRLVSVGMFEHVGRRQYREFCTIWRRLLADNGISLLHTICHRRRGANDPWLNRYIFPGGYLPSPSEVVQSAADAGLRSYRMENLRPHYATTLQHWSANFQAKRDTVIGMFDERFARMWELYLWGSEAGFRWGDLELWQLELYGPQADLPLNRDLIK